MVVCCATPDGDTGFVEGGTNHAVTEALARGIPVINLRTDTWRDDLQTYANITL